MMNFFRKGDWTADDIADAHAHQFDERDAHEFEHEYTEARWFAQFRLMLDMIRDRNFHLRPSTYVKLAGAIAYFVIPNDMVPDLLPGIGFIDDIWVMTVILSSVSEEVDRFQDSKQEG